jgi:hypothetical protein
LSEGVQQGAYPKGEAVMNKLSMLKLSLIAAVLTLASTSTLHAQTSSSLVRVKVPFAFEVGSTQFAPGVYTIGILNRSTLYVRGTDSSAVASMQYGDNGKIIADSRVVFQRIGSQYFLSEVWSSGTTEHLIAYPSKAEKQAQRLEAANHPAAPGVEIAVAQK